VINVADRVGGWRVLTFTVFQVRTTACCYVVQQRRGTHREESVRFPPQALDYAIADRCTTASGALLATSNGTTRAPVHLARHACRLSGRPNRYLAYRAKACQTL